MAKYKYRIKSSTGQTEEGILEASSEKDAVEKLSGMGYVPIHIEEVSGKVESAPPGSSVAGSAKKIKLKSREITVFSRELASLLKAGVPILRALNIISEQSDSPSFKAVLAGIHDAVKEGTTFSSALTEYPAVFPALFLALVRMGENSGSLPEALLRVVEYRTKQEEMVARFRMALAYPILMATVGLATVVFMFVFVIPRLMKIYVSMEQALPLPTRILISISQFLLHKWPIVIIIAGIITIIARRQIITQAGRIYWGLVKLHLPIFGRLILKAELSRFSHTLELLIRNGIPILKAIDIAIPVLNNEVIKAQLKQSTKELEQGGSLGKSLKGSRVFPSFMTNLIIVGEESGKLDDALREIGTAYEKDTEEAIKIMSNLMEPLMILVMGLIVGFIVIAMLLPIFEINVIAR